ncbi:MAG: calcium-binding protein [Hydrococcus sp. RM1_1_31]|nr:calcium-binding protein [Hydrococcus sp. RM1_1_31]
MVNNTLTLDYQEQQFGTADITIRGTSGGKTVDDTFTVTVNSQGKITYGNDANNTLKGNAGRDIIYGLGGNDKIDGKDGNDTLYGGQGSDQLKGNNHNDFLYGEAGNDTLDGGNGFDVLTGVDRNSPLAGRGEIDILKGGRDGDRFVLGDAIRAYYNDGNSSNLGLSDFAFIEDFSSSQGDVIQLHGNAFNYKLGTGTIAGGTAIY